MHHSHHAGAIAGGVIGGIALLVALIGVVLFFRSRYSLISSRIHRHRRQSSANVGTFRKWDGLGSRTSNIGMPIPIANPAAAYKTAQPPSRHPSTGSTAVMLSGHDSSVGHGYYGDDEEKSPVPTAQSSMHGHEPLEYASSHPYDFPPGSVPATPTSAAFPPGRPRARSTSQNRALAFAKLDAGVPRSPTSPGSPQSAYNRQSLDGRMLSSPPTSPSAHPGEMIRLNRTSSGARRATRKAVPKYDETDFQDSAPVHSTPPPPVAAAIQALATQDSENRSSVYYDSRSAATPSSARTSSSNLHEGESTLHDKDSTLHDRESTLHDKESTLHEPTHAGPSIKTARSREDLIAAGYQIPKLTEKASWGDMRNVHYLIPDMPPPQRD